MACFQLVLWYDGGNIPPFARIARELVALGHQVDVLGPVQVRHAFDGAGATYAESEGWMPTADELLARVDATTPDVVVVDVMANATLAGAEAARVPTAVLVHTLLEANRLDDDLGPMFMLGPASETNETRARLGLGPARSHSDILSFADTLLVSAPELLEPPGPRDPRAVYAGPLYVEGSAFDASTLPPGDGPLVVGCAGTGATDPGSEPVLIQRMVDAIASLGHRGIVTVPPYLDGALIRSRPGVSTREFVPHHAVLPHAAALVTHAGLGSVCAALVAKTPMVCLPLGREQPANAAAVVRTQTGVALAPDAAVDEIAAAIEQVIGTPMPVVRVDPSVAIGALERLAS